MAFVVALFLGSLPPADAAPIGAPLARSHSVSALAAQAQDVGLAPRSIVIPIVWALQPRDPVGLARFLADVQDPTSPDFHRFLTPSEYADRFGPSAQEEQRVVDFLQASGMRVTERFPTRLLVAAEGHADAIERAAGVQLRSVVAEGSAGYAARADPKLRADIAPITAAIIGLDNLSQRRAMRAEGGAPLENLGGASTCCFTPTDLDLLYNESHATNNGLGQGIAIAGAYDFLDADFAAFNARAGLSTPTVTRVCVGGSMGSAGCGFDAANSSEISLDVQYAHGTAPSAALYSYMARSTLFTDFVAMEQRIVSDNPAHVVSESWGACEDALSGDIIAATDNTFAAANAIGQTWVFASGDSGSRDCLDAGNHAVTGVDFPAASPYVTAVGGTHASCASGTFSVSGAPACGGYGTESAWGGSGGGASNVHAKPGWQSGCGVPNDGRRDVPDVALEADTRPGNLVRFNGGWYQFGGTSDAAPQIAGMFAALNNKLGGHGLGNINPTLYAACADPLFHDITTGSNGDYSALAGYDRVTGLGSIDEGRLLADLAPAQLVFATQPVGTASNVSLATQPVLRLEDWAGRIVGTDSAHTVTLTLTSPGGATLSGQTTRAFVGGVASFAGLAIDKARAYTLSAVTDAGAFAATSAPLTITPGPAARIIFSTQPGSANATDSLAADPIVTLVDASGNVVNDSTTRVDLLLSPGANLSGVASRALVAGSARFANLSVARTGTYTLNASANVGGFNATSDPFTIRVGPPAQLAFFTQPSNATSGVALGTQPVVAIEDAGGNLVNDSTHTLALSLSVQGATLSGNTSLLARAGVAAFANLSVEKAGTYTLRATSDAGGANATSASFTIFAGAAAQLAFATQPGGAVERANLSRAPIVELRDAAGNPVADSAHRVTLRLNATGAATLAGATNATLVEGAATFSNLSIDLRGAYTLDATTDAGPYNATSAPLQITGAPVRLVFAAQPSDVGAAETLSIAIRVEDANGTLVASDSGRAVNLTLGSPAGATLSNASGIATEGGIATFPRLAIDKAGTYTLFAATAGLANATSAPFTIRVGAPAQLAFAAQPAGAEATSPLATQPILRLLDAGGNLVENISANATVQLSAPDGATLSGARAVAFVNGTAAFANLSVDKVGNHTLLATTSAGAFNATSASFTIRVGPAAALVFATQPGASIVGQPLSRAPVVELRDAGGNLVPQSARNVTLSLVGNATLLGNTTRALANASANLADLVIDRRGSYALRATSDAGAFNATSAPFNVTGVPASLVFTTQPGGAASGSALAPYPVVALVDDAAAIVEADSTHRVQLSLGGAGTLSGVVDAQAQAGVAAFGELSVDRAGTHSLVATTDALAASVTSLSFLVTAGPAAKLVFVRAPGGAQVGAALSPQPMVALEDVNDAIVANDSSDTVTVALAGPNGALSGTATMALSAGLATFGNLALDRAGSFALVATTSAGSFNATSPTFPITSPPAPAAPPAALPAPPPALPPASPPSAAPPGAPPAASAPSPPPASPPPSAPPTPSPEPAAPARVDPAPSQEPTASCSAGCSVERALPDGFAVALRTEADPAARLRLDVTPTSAPPDGVPPAPGQTIASFAAEALDAAGERAKIGHAALTFRVPRASLGDRPVGAVVLEHYHDGAWEALATSLLGDAGADPLTFEATTTSLSPFAVSLDDAPPQIDITVDGGRITVHATDSASGIDAAMLVLSLDGAPLPFALNAEGFGEVAPLGLTPGAHRIVATISDRAGNPARATATLEVVAPVPVSASPVAPGSPARAGPATSPSPSAKAPGAGLAMIAVALAVVAIAARRHRR